MTIGARIKKRREELGLTQTDLAIRMGYKSRAAICNVEKDKEDLTTARIRKYAEALDCSPAYLMGWQEQILQVQKQLDPYTKQLSALAKRMKESFNISESELSAIRNLDAYINELYSLYDASEVEKALKFTIAFLKADPERQRIALEILQLHQENS